VGVQEDDEVKALLFALATAAVLFSPSSQSGHASAALLDGAAAPEMPQGVRHCWGAQEAALA